MLQLKIKDDQNAKLKILCLGAHSDDIEIGCGGTILRLREQFPDCEVHWVVFSAEGIRQVEAMSAAKLFGGDRLAQAPLIKSFPDGFLPFVGAEVKNTFEALKQIGSPDLVFTHFRNDAHQDHRLLSELTWNTFRDNFILEYEIPKYDGDLGRPNVFIPFSAEIADKKINYLLESFRSQRSKSWFEESTFRSLMRLRGMECNSTSGYAEAFYCRKVVL